MCVCLSAVTSFRLSCDDVTDVEKAEYGALLQGVQRLTHELAAMEWPQERDGIPVTRVVVGTGMVMMSRGRFTTGTGMMMMSRGRFTTGIGMMMMSR